MIRFFVLFGLATPLLAAGPYPGAAGTATTDAIAMGDSRFVNWASGHIEYLAGGNVVAQWKTPAKAYGPATDNELDIVCLGDNGKITLYFPHPVRDGAGADFAVFENSFSNGFLELAFVEVSSDGVNFVRFPNASLGTSAVGAFGSVDPTNLSGLAGKYRGGFGTPFDLASLPGSALLDKSNVRFIRLVDIVGDGDAKDSSNRTIYDPYPTTGSAGFDLEAVGVIHQNDGDFQMLRSEPSEGLFQLEWQSNPGRSYEIQSSDTLGGWAPVETVTARQNRGTTVFAAAMGGPGMKFWRVVRVGS